MIEFTSSVEIRLIKTDLGLEEEMASILGGGSDPEEFYSAFLDEELLEHFSVTWVVQAPAMSWSEIESCCSVTPLPMRLDEKDLYYIPGYLDSDYSDDSEQTRLVLAHLENHVEEANQKYLDMIEAGVSEETASMVLPPTRVIKKMVTMSVAELIGAVGKAADGDMTTEAASLIFGLGSAIETCSPIISSILEGNSAFEDN